jgi:hypothetical protein
MHHQNAEPTASRYLEAAGQSSDERYHFDINEFVWLVEHSTHLGQLRLTLLRALQAALLDTSEQGFVVELKELLTSHIIMQTRIQERDDRLSELLDQLNGAGKLDQVPTDPVALREAVQAIVQATGHVKAAIGEIE